MSRRRITSLRLLGLWQRGEPIGRSTKGVDRAFPVLVQQIPRFLLRLRQTVGFLLVFAASHRRFENVLYRNSSS